MPLPGGDGDGGGNSGAYPELDCLLLFGSGLPAWRDALDRSVDTAGLSRKNAQRARFGLSLLTDAFAPTNTWLGNPAAIKKFFDTGGASAARGFMDLLDDIAQNKGMPAQVDKTAFQARRPQTQGPAPFRRHQDGPIESECVTTATSK